MSLEEVYVARPATAAGQLDQGWVKPAMAAYEDLVSDTARVLGPVAPMTIRARLGLGRAFRMAGDAERALVPFESVVRTRRTDWAHGTRTPPDPEGIAEVLLAHRPRSTMGRGVECSMRTTCELRPDHHVTQQVATRLAALPRVLRSATHSSHRAPVTRQLSRALSGGPL